jgi:hypothetical protein
MIDPRNRLTPEQAMIMRWLISAQQNKPEGNAPDFLGIEPPPPPKPKPNRGAMLGGRG